MTGILLLFVAVLWLIVAGGLAWLITRILPTGWWRLPVGLLSYLAMLPLPLVDEIVGKRQFEQLCRENSKIQIDRVKAAGRTVYLADLPDIEIKDTWVRVVLKPWRFIDAKTGELVVSYNTLQAVGGRFVRMLGISEGGVPLTFKSTCVPKDRPASVQAFREFGITYLDAPARGRGR